MKGEGLRARVRVRVRVRVSVMVRIFIQKVLGGKRAYTP